MGEVVADEYKEGREGLGKLVECQFREWCLLKELCRQWYHRLRKKLYTHRCRVFFFSSSYVSSWVRRYLCSWKPLGFIYVNNNKNKFGFIVVMKSVRIFIFQVCLETFLNNPTALQLFIELSTQLWGYWVYIDRQLSELYCVAIILTMNK